MSQQDTGGGNNSKLSGGLIATLIGLLVVVLFVVQNREPVPFHFLWLNFTWPLWLYTILVAVFGAIIWFGLGVMRRHRRRKARRENR